MGLIGFYIRVNSAMSFIWFTCKMTLLYVVNEQYVNFHHECRQLDKKCHGILQCKLMHNKDDFSIFICLY